MEAAKFRKWLAEHGCRFGAESERTLTVRRLGRTAELPLVGENEELDLPSVRQVCQALGLDWSKLL